jgi:hypothetical protein
MFSPDQLAAGVAWVHFAFSAFVVVGFAFIVAGVIWRWEWMRNYWFRSLHLGAVAFEVARSWLVLPCPLTALEHWLRATPTGMAGPAVLHYTSPARVCSPAPPRVPFAIGTTALFGLVLIAYITYGPRSTH